MRRTSLVLIALGAFLIVLAPMVRWYAYPRLAVAPANQNSVTTLVAKGATIFDVTTLKEITTDLTIEVTTHGDAGAPKKHPGSVTYVNTTVTKDSAGTMRAIDDTTGEVKVNGSVERMTFNARTGEATKGVTDDFISDVENEQAPVVHQGLVAKFPFDTKKKTYDFWDADLRKAVPIEYLGTEKVDGVTTYKFAHTIAPTKVGTADVPPSVLGLTGDDNLTADRMYSNDRTLWVEPRTGVILKRTEEQNNTLDYDGQPRVTTTRATIEYDAATVKDNAEKYGDEGRLLNLVHSTGPQIAFIVGLLSLVAGIVLGRRRHTPSNGPRERELAHAHH